MTGCLRRLSKLFRPEEYRTVFLALDHGASQGMIAGLAQIPDIVEGLKGRGVQGVIMNKGLARTYTLDLPHETNLIVQLSAGTKHGEPNYNKSIVCSVQEALRHGADAVSVHVNIGNELEDRMLTDLGIVTDEAHNLGIPVMATVYPQGAQILNELDPTLIAHCIRVGAELGPDIVSVPYSGEPNSFAEAVNASPVPVLVAGGPSQPDFESFLNMLKEALDTGAAGVCVGRNIFQQENPLESLDAVVRLVHGLE